MQLKQYYLGCLSHASYLITDEKTHTAVVVDPQRDIEQYLADAAAVGCEIKYVFLTHFHADFLAGPYRTAGQVRGQDLSRPARRSRSLTATKVKDGDRIEFGDVRLEILETPGHTPEGISILVYDLAKNTEKPLAVLTGDTLFIGDVGRPDLLASIGVTADELADMLYDSLTNKLVKLPDETLVYPAHGAGSMCGKNLSKETVSTIGEQKKFNYALQPMSREEFKTHRHRRTAGGTELLRPRRDPEPPGAAESGRNAVGIAERAVARRSAAAARTKARSCSMCATPSTSREPIWPARSTSASRESTRPGAERCSTTTHPIVVIAEPARRKRRSCGWDASASTMSPATCAMAWTRCAIGPTWSPRSTASRPSRWPSNCATADRADRGRRAQRERVGRRPHRRQP